MRIKTDRKKEIVKLLHNKLQFTIHNEADYGSELSLIILGHDGNQLKSKHSICEYM